jgi:hypothetical protein
MIYLPTYRLAKVVVLGITKVFRLDLMYYKLFASLFQLTGSLFFNFGVIPTMKVVWNVFLAIYKNNNYQALTRLLNHVNLNPAITSKVLDVLAPYWTYCIKNPSTFKRLYNFYMFSVLFSTFRLSFTFIIRTFFTTSLLSIGILWNEFLSSFTLLANVSHYIIDNSLGVFKQIVNIIKQVPPISVDNISLPVDNKGLPLLGDEGTPGEVDVWYRGLAIVSLVVLRLTGIVIIGMIGDYYTPDTVRSIPYAGNILDSVYGFINSLYKWYYGKPDIGDAPKPGDLSYQPRIPRPRTVMMPKAGFSAQRMERSASDQTVTPDDFMPTPPGTPANLSAFPDVEMNPFE